MKEKKQKASRISSLNTTISNTEKSDKKNKASIICNSTIENKKKFA